MRNTNKVTILLLRAILIIKPCYIIYQFLLLQFTNTEKTRNKAKVWGIFAEWKRDLANLLLMLMGD